MRYSFVTVGLWWALFSQYTFYYLPKGVSKEGKEVKDVLLNGFRELKLVWNQLKQNLRLKRFLHAFFVYSMAVQTIMLMAVYFGEQEIAWSDSTEKTSFFQSATGIAISIGVLFATIWVASKAWKTGQK